MMVLLCFLWLLAIQDICVYSVTHNRGLFSLEGLHHCLSPGAYHVSTYLIFFFPQEGLHAAIFSTLHVLEAIHTLGHMARTAEIFPVIPRRGFSP